MKESGMKEAEIFTMKFGKRIAYGLRFMNQYGRPTLISSRWATVDYVRTFAMAYGITIVDGENNV